MISCHFFQSVTETLTIGASLLLPPLRERMELLHSLLPQGPESWENLTKGQVEDDFVNDQMYLIKNMSSDQSELAILNFQSL